MNKQVTVAMNLENIADIGSKIRKHLIKRMLVIISGPMGVGKTELIKNILPEYSVTSPSFLHANLYGNVESSKECANFAHIDAYTIKSKEALFSLDIDELLKDRCVIVEWGELFEKEFEIFDATILKIELIQNGKERFIFLNNSDILL